MIPFSKNKLLVFWGAKKNDNRQGPGLGRARGPVGPGPWAPWALYGPMGPMGLIGLNGSYIGPYIPYTGNI